ncbi:MAG: hypothetical protein AAFP70_09080, partial [Calditrichota bacterium]
IRLNKAALFKSPDSVCIELEVFNESGKDIFYNTGGGPAFRRDELSIEFGIVATAPPKQKPASERLIRLASNTGMMETLISYRKIQSGKKDVLTYSMPLKKVKTAERPQGYKELRYRVRFGYVFSNKVYEIPEPDKDGIYIMSNHYAMLYANYLLVSGCVTIPGSNVD